MVHVKSFFGIVLLIVAAYFLSNAFPALSRAVPGGTTGVALATGAVVGGILLGAIHRDFSSDTSGGRVAKALGIALVTLGGFTAVALVTRPSGSFT
jgi:thiol:disulfide interchange protein DsbD